MPDTLRPADRDQAERLHTFAHDLKNRLHALWETLRMLQDNPAEGPDRAALMAFAERGYFSAQRDVERLLDDLAVDRNVKAERAPIDLRDCLDRALRNEEHRLTKKAQTVALNIPADLTATGDAHWSTQILQALISNASKFSAAGSVITVDAITTPEDRTLMVCDHGVGLAEADLPNVFTRYAILSSRSTQGEPQARGTLARARQWARAQGGDLHAESAGSGQGARFSFVLPAA